MIFRTLITAICLLLLTVAVPQSHSQARFFGFVPHGVETDNPEIQKQEDYTNWYNGEESVLRFLTLDIDQTPKNIASLPSQLIVPGSGTIPNSAFISQTLRVMGFEAPSTPYVLLDNLTHHQMEVYAFEDLLRYLKAQPEGSVFILGLDCKTGFVRKENGEFTFLSADGNAASMPVSKNLEVAIRKSESHVYIIGDLSERARIIVGIDAI